MITLNGIEVKVIGADIAERIVTVQWKDERVRYVSLLALKGTKGGDLEVLTVCREVERKAKAMEAAK